MPTYVAFLRAINLGPTRKFPKANIVAAAEAVGGTDVATYINTGNVRLRLTLRSRARVEQALEAAFLEDRGFEVPTVVFTPVELRAVGDDVADLGDSHPGRHYVSLLKEAPSAAGREVLEQSGGDHERAFVRGRAVHLLLGPDYHTARLTNAAVERHLGVATNRNATVITKLADMWGR